MIILRFVGTLLSGGISAATHLVACGVLCARDYPLIIYEIHIVLAVSQVVDLSYGAFLIEYVHIAFEYITDKGNNDLLIGLTINLVTTPKTLPSREPSKNSPCPNGIDNLRYR